MDIPKRELHWTKKKKKDWGGVHKIYHHKSYLSTDDFLLQKINLWFTRFFSANLLWILV